MAPWRLTRPQLGFSPVTPLAADGQRITKQVGSGSTILYIVDGRTTLAVYTVNAAGAAVSSYFNIIAHGRVVGREALAVKRYYHTDLVGSTRAVVENGAIIESYDYDAWGVLLDGRILAGPTKEGFTGKERDAETGLDYFGFRYYMPAIGRWTTVDPPSDEFPGWSPYNYVLNNPVTYTDPFGLIPGLDQPLPPGVGGNPIPLNPKIPENPKSSPKPPVPPDPCKFCQAIGGNPNSPRGCTGGPGGVCIAGQPIPRDQHPAAKAGLGALGQALSGKPTE